MDINQGLQTISGLATETKQDDIITAIEAVSGLQRATDLEGLGLQVVGTSEVALVFTGTPEVINIESVIGNSGIIYIGKTGVGNDGSNAIASLEPGASIQMDYNDTTNTLYVISDTAAQSFIAGCLK